METKNTAQNAINFYRFPNFTTTKEMAINVNVKIASRRIEKKGILSKRIN